MNINVTLVTQRNDIKPKQGLIREMVVMLRLFFVALIADAGRHTGEQSTLNGIIYRSFGFESFWVARDTLGVADFIYFFSSISDAIPFIVFSMPLLVAWIASIFFYIFFFSLSNRWVGFVAFSLLSQLRLPDYWIRISLFCIYAFAVFAHTNMPVFFSTRFVELIKRFGFFAFVTAFHFTPHKKSPGNDLCVSPNRPPGHSLKYYKTITSLFGDNSILAFSRSLSSA